MTILTINLSKLFRAEKAAPSEKPILFASNVLNNDACSPKKLNRVLKMRYESLSTKFFSASALSMRLCTTTTKACSELEKYRFPGNHSIQNL